jgi:hypothetical protein
LKNYLLHAVARVAHHDPQNRSTRLARRDKPTASASPAMLAKGFVLILAVIVGLSGTPAHAAADGAPIAFIRTLGDQAVSVLRSDMPLTTKAAYFDQMVRQDFDLTGIARFVLGPFGASRARRNGNSSATALQTGSFVSMAGSSRNPATEISSSPAAGRIPTASSLTAGSFVPKAHRSPWFGGLGSGMASTRSRMSRSTASAWRWPSAQKSRR